MNDHSNPPDLPLRGMAAGPARGRPGRFALAAALLGLAMARPAHAGCQVETVELPVKMVGSRAVATVGINGTPVPLTVDSGAFFSMLTEAAAAQLKLPLSRNDRLRVEGLTGRVETFTTRVEKLQLLNGEVKRVEFIVGGNEPGAGTLGLMGRNLLSFTDTEYDLAHGVIRFHFPNDQCDRADMAYWAGTTPVTEVELETGFRDGKLPSIRARAKLNGSEVIALFDSGATTVVTPRAAQRAGVAESAMTRAGSVFGAGRGSVSAWTASFESFEIGGETVRNNKLQVADLNIANADMLLGIDFFLSHRIYVSKKQSKMFFTYEGGTVFALNNKLEAPAAAGPAASGASNLTADQLARRGAASAARRDLDSALADLDRACELDPTSAPLFAQRGVIEASLRRPAKALLDFDKALALDPTQADARTQRAGLRLRAKDVDGARADLDVLDKTLAPQSQARLVLSNLFLNLNEPARALDQLNQWLPAHPREARRDVALNSRCRLRARLGVELNEAVDDCDDAIDADSKNANYLDSRGWVYWRLGKYRKALADFDRSVGFRPEGAWSLYGRGLTRLRLGDAVQGEADIAAAKQAEPDIELKASRARLTEPSASKP